MVAAIGQQILGPTDVSLSNWTVRSSGPGHAHRGSKCGRLHPDPGGEPVEHCAHPQRDSGPRAPLRLPLRLGTASNFVVYMSEADNVYDPLYGSFVLTRLEHGQDVLRSAAKRGGMHFGVISRRRTCPDGRNGGRLRRPATQRRRRTRRLRRCC